MTRFIALFLALSLKVLAFSQSSSILESPDTRLFFQTFGEGKPLLVINGGPGMSSEGFRALAGSLAEMGRQVILFDQRGTGKSTLRAAPDSTNISMEAMVADMEALREHLGFERWTLLGHSFGGMLAGSYTARYPHRVDGLIFSASGGLNLGLLDYIEQAVQERLTETEQDSLRYWSGKIAAGDTSHHAALRRGMALAPAYLHNREFVPVIAERLTQGNMLINRLVWQDLNRIRFDCREAITAFEGPVLIIQGKEDIISEETIDVTRRALPQSSVVLLEACSHYGWLDQPEAYFAAVRGFLLAGE